MSSKGLGGAVLSAGLGAMATVAGLYLVKKVKGYMRPKPKMKLFHKHLCLSTRCAWLISELGAEADFDLTEDLPATLSDTFCSSELLMLQDPDTGNVFYDKEAFFPIVPFNKNDVDAPDYPDPSFEVPTMPYKSTLPAVVVNDEFTMIEGAAICMYLADLYGQFLPPAEHKAEYYSWIVYSAATFDNILKTLHQQLVESPESRRDDVLLQSATSGFHAFARALSDSLEGRVYLCGKRFTAADCVVGFTLWWAYTLDQGSLLSEHPVLLEYLSRLRDRPAFQKTFGMNAEDWDWGQYFSTYVRGIQT